VPVLQWVGPVLLAAYGCAAAVFLGRWVLAQLALARLLRRARPSPEPLARLFAATAGGRTPGRLLVSADVRVPFSCGLLRPTVVLPAALADAGRPEELRWVFAHERTHLERRDAWAGLLLGLAGVVYFYLPWFWWLRRSVRLCQEYLADAAAARTGTPADYAEFLVGWAPAPAAPAGVHGVTGSRSDLFRRIDMLLNNPTPTEPRCPWRWSFLTAGGLLGLAVLFSGVGADAAPAPGAKAPPKKEPAKAAPKKEAPKEEEPGKADKDDNVPDLNEVLKHLGDGLDAKQMEQLRKEIESRRGEIEKALRQVRELQGQLPGMPEGFAFQFRGHTGRLGVRIAPPSPTLADQLGLPKGQGIVVEDVAADSPAAHAGLKAHDVLLKLGGKTVPSNPAAVARMVADLEADKPLEAVVVRKGKHETVKGIKLPKAGAPADGPAGFGPAGAMPDLKALAPLGKLGTAGLALGHLGTAHGKGVVTTTLSNDGRFTTRHHEGSLAISVTGKVTDGKAHADEVVVQDGGERHTYSSVDKVPERYRDKVKNLLDMTARGAKLEDNAKDETKE
jgi:hypothetical protein